MTVAVIIPLGKEENPLRYDFDGADEIFFMREGTASRNRNLGASRANSDELIFLDSDVLLPPKLNLGKLRLYGCDIATAKWKMQSGDWHLEAWQRFWAETGSPFAFYGGFMYVKKKVFWDVGGFRECLGEDVEFAQRAWVKGYKIGCFPFEVIHTRPVHWSSYAGVVAGKKWLWGMP